MNKTQIEWAKNPDGSQGYTWNPITGCLNHTNGLCKGGDFPCYAYKLAHGRLSSRYLSGGIVAAEGIDHENLSAPFYPRFWEERASELDARNKYIHDINQAPKERGIFVCDMGDLFGTGVPEMWTTDILNRIDLNDGYDRFYLLTKQPQNLIQFNPFPENAWVGVTATNADMCIRAGYCFTKIEAKLKFLSLEPLLGWQHGEPGFIATMLQNWGINWLIIGACTGTEKALREIPGLTLMPWERKWTAQPKIEWVQEIVQAADKAGIRVFLKDNLMPLFKRGDIWAIPEWALFNDWAKQDIGTTLRQEMPVKL